MNDSENSLINQITLEETFPYREANFSYRCGLFHAHTYPGGQYPWHWHNEVEFFYMRKGALEYHVPGGVEVFHEGEGGFINASVLHSTRIHGSAESLQEEHIFLPGLIAGCSGSAIERRYVSPIILSRKIEVFRLHPANFQHRQMIALMSSAFDIYEKQPQGFELHIRNLLSELWLNLFLETSDLHSAQCIIDQQESRIKAMLTYIAAHYSEPLSLSEIAAVAYISPRECLRAFRKTLNISPIEYLIEYRLLKAQELLRNTDQSISDISASCGFSSSSYFGKTFRKQFGFTPREFRTNCASSK